MMMKVYISGKMSGLSRQEIMQRFLRAEHILRNQGYTTCNPVRFVFFRWQWLYDLLGYHLALCIDLYMLSHCDAIYMIGDDWQQSDGASVEHFYAYTFGHHRMYETAKHVKTTMTYEYHNQRQILCGPP